MSTNFHCRSCDMRWFTHRRDGPRRERCSRCGKFAKHDWNTSLIRSEPDWVSDLLRDGIRR